MERQTQKPKILRTFNLRSASDDMKVYGPYLRKDGRKHVVIIDGKRRRTVSYPKYLMEQYLGRELSRDETVHHKDGDYTNDDLNNLELINRSDHVLQDIKRTKFIELICIECGKTFERNPRTVNRSATRKCAGPFCSKHCSGKYGARIQNGGDKEAPQEFTEISHYNLSRSKDFEDSPPTVYKS